ncbi:TetR/AcrR family transcriptional regulator [Gordonia jinhuaensis]|uniref:TetR/AcrR family transcriptional regulator n=1 Tax=Gordonia jinhuaensis TaxID=1517702 RepID=UPI001663461A|nr:TetR/AcrR family transcriptional regulator [Gordonia jinhuaensis]
MVDATDVLGATAPGLRELKKAEVRSLLTRVARTHGQRRGYDATTVSDICEDARVSRSTFFRYFSDKAAVFLAPEVDLFERFLAYVGDRTATFQMLDQTLDRALQSLDDEWAYSFALSCDFAKGSADLAKHSFDHCVDIEVVLTNNLIRAGEPDSLETRLKVGTFLASWRIASSRWADFEDRSLNSLRSERTLACALVQSVAVM